MTVRKNNLEPRDAIKPAPPGGYKWPEVKYQDTEGVAPSKKESAPPVGDKVNVSKPKRRFFKFKR